MKPTTQTTGNGRSTRENTRRFPVTDYNYSTVSLGEMDGSCARVKTPSFHEISSDYFKGEACNYFLAEAAVFGLTLAAAALPLIAGALAVFNLVKTLAI